MLFWCCCYPLALRPCSCFPLEPPSLHALLHTSLLPSQPVHASTSAFLSPQVIENFDLFRASLAVREEEEGAIAAAQAILGRLRRRQLYKYVTDALIPQARPNMGCCAAVRLRFGWLVGRGSRNRSATRCPPTNRPARPPARSAQDILERERWEAPSPQDVVNSYRGSDVRLRAEDVILQARWWPGPGGLAGHCQPCCCSAAEVA